MNPGYAGRTELPDNLKVLFRPVAMMAPDFVAICKISLMSEGFKQNDVLSKKVTTIYELMKKQLLLRVTALFSVHLQGQPEVSGTHH